jgi:8-amino-7-oxononanoate synthase
VRQFEANSETRVHCSPPSAAAYRAVEHALDVNDTSGDAIRLALAASVQSFRRAVLERGLRLAPGLFPVQTLDGRGVDVNRLHRRLLARGVRALLHGTAPSRARLSFLITAAHRDGELHAAADVLADVAARCHRPRQQEDTHDCRIPLRA